ncbi:hypothetical protein OBBRIDRAFT_741595 [Obba rivulosa]|uniref:DUF6533 domain-containing protein n=1 Tax=Obba rivulosa TaxID=1052685 RepID=A0A8E2ASK8_9APHY|nr:hypothetical protein OBBRIDRAFT_741595 [Obba rivulosa]
MWCPLKWFHQPVLVFYDHITTLPREVNLIWGRKLNSVTLLFYLNRWATFMWAVVQLAEFASLDTLSVIFSAIRVYAISGGSWIWPMIVFTLSMVPVGTNLVRSLPVSLTLRFTHSASMLCILQDNYFVTAWYGVIQVPVTIGTRVCTIVADLLILIITWSKTYTTKRAADRSNVNTPITTMLLKDGV